MNNATLRAAPPIADLEADLAARVNGRYLVGHNIGVDWRLLHRHRPTVNPAGLIDTLRPAHAHPEAKPDTLF